MTAFHLVFFLVVAGIVGLGFYWDWFLLPSERASFQNRMTFPAHSSPPTEHEQSVQTSSTL